MASQSRFALRFFFTMLLLSVLFYALVHESFFRLPGSALLRLVNPITQRFTSIVTSIVGGGSSFFRIASLSRSVRILEEQNDALTAELAKLRSVQQENTDVRKELGLLPRAQFRVVNADVVGRTADGIKDALILNRGTHDGVQEGKSVIVENGILIGTIQHADTFTSTVALLSDSSFRVSARTMSTEAEGLVHGARGLDILMDNIPRTSKMKTGDTVVTTGTDGVAPPHLYVGKVVSIDTPGNDIFQSARIEPQVDIRHVRFASILLP